MPKKPAIRSLRIQNLLSFGDKTPAFELKNLNVLIGPNGAGKSNFIEIIGLLRSVPRDLAEAVRLGGGPIEWLWKGASTVPTATLEVLVNPEHGYPPLRYRLQFTRSSHRLELKDERLESGRAPKKTYFVYDGARSVLSIKGAREKLLTDEINRPILSRLRGPEYPELTYIAELFESVRLYPTWEFGPRAPVRGLASVDLASSFLSENAGNLGLVLDRLLTQPTLNRQVVQHLKMFYADAEDLHVPIKQRVVEINLEEKYLKSTIPARWMSDGTLRWLALLTILLDPEPAPVICIEEPELGLHPDVIHEVAKLLLDASQRTQLIVTTHSEILVEALNDSPEAIVVCEKEQGATTLTRLSRKELSRWLKDYSLGQLWRKGQIGGNRW